MNFAKVFDESHHSKILAFGHKNWNLENIYGKVFFRRKVDAMDQSESDHSFPMGYGVIKINHISRSTLF